MLVCRNCGGTIRFGADGWHHRHSAPTCPRLEVAWPPPEYADREDERLPAPRW